MQQIDNLRLLPLAYKNRPTQDEMSRAFVFLAGKNIGCPSSLSYALCVILDIGKYIFYS